MWEYKALADPLDLGRKANIRNTLIKLPGHFRNVFMFLQFISSAHRDISLVWFKSYSIFILQPAIMVYSAVTFIDVKFFSASGTMHLSWPSYCQC